MVTSVVAKKLLISYKDFILGFIMIQKDIGEEIIEELKKLIEDLKKLKKNHEKKFPITPLD